MKPITPKSALYNAYRAYINGRLLPYQVIKNLVVESKAFLLGDGQKRKIKVKANDIEKQSKINSILEDCNFYTELDSAVLDAFIYEGYLDFSDPSKLRAISAEDVSEVYYDPDNKYRVVYLRETRQGWDATSNTYVPIEVEHYLKQPISNADLDILDLKEHKYVKVINGIVEEFDFNYVPIVRISIELDGIDSASFIEPLIIPQLEYNDVRNRIQEYNKSHRPQMYSIGSSMPKVIGRTNKVKPEPIDTPSGSAIYQTTFNEGEPSIIHMEISKSAREAGIQPKLGYAQPVDSTMLERQASIIERDIYKMTGVPSVLELENARSASSSSSLSVLYEPLQRRTLKRAEHVLQAVKIILDVLGIKDYSIELPNMMPRNIEAEKLELEKVKNKVISRKTFLIQTNGLSSSQAEEELQNLRDERILAVQFSGVLTDSQDVPNVDKGSLLETLDKKTNIEKDIV